RLRDADGVAAAFLDAVEGCVGAAEERVEQLALPRDRAADADREAIGGFRGFEREGFDRRANPLSQETCDRDIGLGREDAEFLSAQPAYDRLVSGVIADGGGDILQGDVADRVAEAVVDRLEMVGVDNEQRASPASSECRGDG